MKKHMWLVLLILVMASMVGCNNQPKLSTETGTDVKADLESKDKGKDKDKDSEENQTGVDEKNTEKNAIDESGTSDSDSEIINSVRDIKGLYTYFNESIDTVSEKDFEERYKLFYLDFTNDGEEDVVLLNTAAYDTFKFVTVVDNTFQLIQTEGMETSYSFDIEISGQFIIVTGHPSGTGLSGEYKKIAVYDDNKIQLITDELYLEYFAGAQSYDEGVGHIKLLDRYNEFSYSYEEFFIAGDTKEQKIAINLHYEYDEEKAQYVIIEEGKNYNKHIKSNGIKKTTNRESKYKNIAIGNLKESTDYLTDMEISKTGALEIKYSAEILNSLSVFGTIKNVEIGYWEAEGTEAPFIMVDYYDVLKNTNILLPRIMDPKGSQLYVRFQDEGYRSHFFNFSYEPLTQKLYPELTKEEKARSSYTTFDNDIFMLLGMTESELLKSTIFKKIEETNYGKGYDIYVSNNDPLGINVEIKVYKGIVSELMFVLDGDYNEIGEFRKISILGTDFTKSKYAAMANLEIDQEKYSVTFMDSGLEHTNIERIIIGLKSFSNLELW